VLQQAPPPTRPSTIVSTCCGCVGVLAAGILAAIVAIVWSAMYPANPHTSEGICPMLPDHCPSGNGFANKPFQVSTDEYHYSSPCALCKKDGMKKTCCTEEGYGNKTNYLDYFQGVRANSTCGLFLGKLSCAPCAPSAAWYTEDFDIGSDQGAQPIYVCDFYCKTIYDACKDYALSDVTDSPGDRLGDLYPAYSSDICPDVFKTETNKLQAFAGIHCFSAGKALVVGLWVKYVLVAINVALAACTMDMGWA